MSASTDPYPLNSPLTLRDDQDTPLTLILVDLQLSSPSDPSRTCRATFQLQRDQVQDIEARSLFNLEPEIRSPLSGGPWQADHPIYLEASLDPDLRSRLPALEDKQEGREWLRCLPEADPIRSVDYWYGLRLVQPSPTGETGYTSLWAYLAPEWLGQDPIPTQALSEAMIAFSQVCDPYRSGFSANQTPDQTEDQTQVIAQVSQTVESLLGRFTDEIESSFSGVADEIAASLSGAFDPLSTLVEETMEDLVEETVGQGSAGRSDDLLQLMSECLREDGWIVEPVTGETMVLTLYQGDQSQWECWAETHEADRQILFYSICPVVATIEVRAQVAEMICRANWDLAIGNFELDWDRGQIRFKTSLDVTGDRLSPPLVRTLIYSNVLTLETYLPAITAVIESGVDPIGALEQVEQG